MGYVVQPNYVLTSERHDKLSTSDLPPVIDSNSLIGQGRPQVSVVCDGWLIHLVVIEPLQKLSRFAKGGGD